MRLKQCRICGAAFPGGQYQRVCPTCLAEQTKTTLRDRVCRECGITFPGGPRAWYCPTCRTARQRENEKRYKAAGTTRKIGSEDICTVCGKPYVVNSARQKYCPACAPEAIKQADRVAAIRWNQENADRVRELKAQNIKLCAICQKPIGSNQPVATCSPECQRELKRRNQQRADAKRLKKTNGNEVL